MERQAKGAANPPDLTTPGHRRLPKPCVSPTGHMMFGRFHQQQRGPMAAAATLACLGLLLLPAATTVHAFTAAGRPKPPVPSTATAPPRTGPSSLVAAASASASSTASAGHEQAAAGGEEAPFDWWKQWYPIALTRDVDPSAPTKATLLGRELVLWREGGGSGGSSKRKPQRADGRDTAWRCFLDRCPHRLAPLSEGRIDGKTGHLQCAYHGWEFDAAGACTKIPQEDPDLVAAAAASGHPSPALASRRACATALPTLEAQGMVWVWPDTSPEGLAASLTTPPNTMPDVDERAMSHLVVARDMPYGFDTLLENGIDPSHLPFAHHNIISHRSQAAFIDIKVDEIRRDGFDSADFFPKKRRMLPSSPAAADADAEGEGEGGEAGLVADAKKAAARPRRKAPAMIPVPQSLHFRPPNLLYQIINVTEVLNKLPFLPKKERVIRIVTYAVPVAPGKSRVMYRFLRNYFLPPFRFLRWPPEWVEHLRILRVLDSDTVFLHGQERELRLLGPPPPSAAGGDVDIDRLYYMPTPADGSVRALRKWVSKFGGPRWLVPGMGSALPPLERDRRKLLDRYESHTRQCKVCRGALTNLRRLRHGITFLSVMAFYLGLLGQSVYTRLAGGLLTVLGIAGAAVLRKWEALFRYSPWDHSKNH